MKALIQRVKHAKVQVDNKDISSINEGLLIFLGIHKEDTFDETDYIVNKILNLRLFPKNKSESGFDISIIDSLRDILVISQFTLYASTRKGRKPDFSEAANSKLANSIYENFLAKLKQKNLNIKSGEFGSVMEITSINWGPVSIMIDSKERNIPRKKIR